MLVLCVVLAGGWKPLPSRAQSYAFDASWRWQLFTMESGLPSNDVLSFRQTADGTLWTSTEGGLAWYDAFRWQVVTRRRLLPIVPDLKGRLLGLDQGKLFRVDQHAVTAVPVRWRGDSLYVTSVAPLRPDTLVVVTTDGLFRLEAGTVRPLLAPSAGIDWTLEGTWVQRTYRGDLVLNSRQGVYRWAGDQWTRWYDIFVDRLQEDTLGGALSMIGNTARQGLWVWHRGGRPHRAGTESSEPIVAALALGPGGRGVTIYENGRVRVREEGQWRWHEASVPAMQQAHFAHYDASGSLWLGSEEGLHRFQAHPRRWTRSKDHSSRHPNHVNAILRTLNGDLWLGGEDGLYLRTAEGHEAFIGSVAETPLRDVTGLAEDRQGGIWVTSGAGFTGAFRRHDGAWQRYGPEDGLPAVAFHRIERDREGRLWFLGLPPEDGLVGGGAFVWEDGHFEQWTVEDGLLNDRVYSMAQGPDGALWFGTVAGLSRWKEGEWQHWQREDGLRMNRLFDLAVDEDGTVWFGHQEGEGLGHLDADGTLAYHDVADGLIDARVWELQLSPDGSLWIATPDGLGRRLPNGHFAAFGRASGLQQPRIWPVLPLEDRVLVGTIGDGLYTLSRAEDANPPPRVEFAERGEGNNRLIRWRVFPYLAEQKAERVATRWHLNDAAWSPWSHSREASVLNLAPGSHTLYVQARSLFGHVQPGGASYMMYVTPPFYRQLWFLAILVAGLLGLTALVVTEGHRWRRQRLLLQQREASLAEAQRIAHIGSFELDLETNRLHWSEELFRIYGVEAEAYKGHTEQLLGTMVHPDDREEVEKAMARAIHTGEPAEHTYRIVRPDGSVRHVVARGQCRYDEGGTPRQLVGTVQDVTERTQAEEAVRRAERELLARKESEKARVEAELARISDELVSQTRLAAIGQVVASIAHELRNPLGAVRNAAYYLKRHVPAAGTKWSEYLGIIEHEVETANQIIRDLLEMSRPKVALKRTVVLRAAVQHAFTRINGVESLTVRCEFPDGYEVLVDPGQFQQVLVNLFANAAEAMEYQGEIIVEARREGTVDEVLVRDSGPGIDPETREHLFEPLFTTKAKGTGLGLAVCRQIIEGHEGTLDLADAETPGAVFRLRLLAPVVESTKPANV